MKKINLLLILLSFISCEKQANRDCIKFHTKNIINIDNLQYDSVGFSDNYDKLQKLDIQEISLDEFIKLNVMKKTFVKIPMKKEKKYYYLETTDKILQLQVEKETTEIKKNWYDILGFYTNLNMYAISNNSVSEGLGFSDLELINKSNGKIYKIVSPGDDKIENPIPSTQSQYLAYFHNQVYDENNSFLGILKFDSSNNLTEYKSYTSENFKIYQIAWSVDDLILIKISSDNGKNFKYYKSNILSKNVDFEELDNHDKWKGTYFLKTSNRDKINTVFNITINSLSDISIKITNDIEESYSHIKAEKINNNKIKIVYNTSIEDEMGIIFIEKLENEYYVSGMPITMINPGNEEYPLQKIK